MSLLTLNGARLTLDPSGALWWPEEGTLVLADLHLEKGPGPARLGRLLPPDQRRTTLDRLAVVIRRYRPRRVVVLDARIGAIAPFEADDNERLARLVSEHDWSWIVGVEDAPPRALFGAPVVRELALPPLMLRAAPGEDYHPGEVCGQRHPKAAVRLRGRRISGRCFVNDGVRLAIPAFGAHAGGLDPLDPAIASLFRERMGIHLIGRDAIYLFPAERLERMQPPQEALAAAR